ncbi:MAG: hypothetical protein QXW00_01055 [Candidatus Woesearchaeota archaeon]
MNKSVAIGEHGAISMKKITKRISSIIPKETYVTLRKSNSGLKYYVNTNTTSNPFFNKVVVRDYENCRENITLCTSDEVKDLLLMQTVEGHARKGHGLFSSNKGPTNIFLNASMEDVVEALASYYGIDKEKIKKKREDLINEIYSTAENAVVLIKMVGSGEMYSKQQTGLELVNSQREPLMGANFLKGYVVKDLVAFLKGICLGGLMDNIQLRKRVMQRYKFTPYEIEMGGGECLPINYEKMRNTPLEEVVGKVGKRFYCPYGEKSLTLEFLSSNYLEDYIERLNELGIILDKPVESTPMLRSGYVRHLVGKGVSDDLAVIIAGIKYGMDAAIGVYLIDAIDTLDKYVPTIYPGGMDEKLANNILGLMPNLLSEDEILGFIRAIANSAENIADCSQRRFLQVQEENISAIEAHINFIKTGKPQKGLLFGYSGIPSEEFYKNVEKRLKEVDRIYATG